MKVIHYQKVESQVVPMRGAERVSIRRPLAVADGVPTFTMRVFTFEAGGHTPYHRHDYEHEVFVLTGRGWVLFEGGRKRLEPGVVTFVEPNEWQIGRASCRERV